MKDKILKIIYTSIENENKFLAHPINLAQEEKVALYGGEGGLDSISLVSVVCEVERLMALELKIEITLVTDRAMSRKTSPFKSVGSFADYIAEQTAVVPHA